MKTYFLCIAILITFCESIIAEVEFYPDYQRPDAAEEEWAKDQPLNQNFQPYYENQRQFLYQQDRAGLPYLNGIHKSKQSDLTWPKLAAENLFKNKQLARRISEISRKFEEINKKPQYYFKTFSHNKIQPNYNIFDSLEDKINDDFVLNYKPNSHILDDVRIRPNDENEELSLPNDDVNFEIGNGNSKEDYEGAGEEKHLHHVVDEEIEQNLNLPKVEFANVKMADDPTEFAYPPSDPRYFEESTTNVLKTTSSNEKKLEKEDSYTPYNEINRNNNYRNQQLLPVISNVKHTIVGSDVVAVKPSRDDTTGVYIIATVAGISAAATVALIAFGIGWYNIQKHVKNASDVEYPAYGVTGPNKEISPSGDRKLAQSAQMYHYQHQKQQIIAMESRAAANERHGSVSEIDSDEENEEGDYTVYECPGLAPTGEMEVKNPLFQDDPTPAQTPAQKLVEGDDKKK